MTPEITDPAEIAEVDGFRTIPETPQHDGVQRWCSLATTQPFERPHEREKRERDGKGAPGRGEHVACFCVFSSLPGRAFI
jgi:hypothetical protein